MCFNKMSTFLILKKKKIIKPILHIFIIFYNILNSEQYNIINSIIIYFDHYYDVVTFFATTVYQFLYLFISRVHFNYIYSFDYGLWDIFTLSS